MSLKPLADRVIAKKEAPQTTTKSGILLGEAKEPANIATIESVGPDVKELKAGDRVVYREYSATTIKIDGAERLVIKEEDILATF